MVNEITGYEIRIYQNLLLTSTSGLTVDYIARCEIALSLHSF